jgi:hypothetical protein
MAMLSCLASSAWAQGQLATPLSPATAVAKPAVKKTPSKLKGAVKLAAPADSGHCQLGVIPALGE